MSADDKRMLGRIQLRRVQVPVRPADEDPPSSTTRDAAPPTVDLDEITISRAALDVMPRPAAEVQRVLPLEVDGTHVVVAMADPGDERVLAEIAFATGKAVVARRVDANVLLDAIERAYDAVERGDAVYRGPRARDPR